QGRVETGQGEIHLGQGQLHVPDQIVEEGETAHHVREELPFILPPVGEALQGIANPEPGRDHVPALHPAETPRNGPQVRQVAGCPAARRARADLGQLEFQDRCRLLEIGDYVRVFRNLFTVEEI